MKSATNSTADQLPATKVGVWATANESVSAAARKRKKRTPKHKPEVNDHRWLGLKELAEINGVPVAKVVAGAIDAYLSGRAKRYACEDEVLRCARNNAAELGRRVLLLDNIYRQVAPKVYALKSPQDLEAACRMDVFIYQFGQLSTAIAATWQLLEPLLATTVAVAYRRRRKRRSKISALQEDSQ